MFGGQEIGELRRFILINIENYINGSGKLFQTQKAGSGFKDVVLRGGEALKIFVKFFFFF